MNPVGRIEGKAYPFGLKNVECDVLKRMASMVFTARDPRQRQQIAAPLFWIACRAPMALRDFNADVAPWDFREYRPPMFLR